MIKLLCGYNIQCTHMYLDSDRNSRILINMIFVWLFNYCLFIWIYVISW
jgi:hypothetical protein